MKKLFFLIALFCAFGVSSAQTADSIKSLEVRIQNLENIVASLQHQIEEVTSQNLALKHAISLTPTMAEYTSENGVIYRLLEAKGNREKGEFELIISVLNPTKRDINVSYENGPEMVDETGYGYVYYKDQIAATIANNGVCTTTTLMPDAPVEMVLRFVVNHAPQYIKAFKLNGSSGRRDCAFRFANIPIKWE